MTAQIEPPHLPLRLYRYRSLKDDNALKRELDVIKNSYLWCSDFTSLNDPMEGIFRPSSLINEANAIEIKKLIEHGIACFSESYNNELMWAHYAGNYGGICIAYNSKRLQRRLDDTARLVRVAYVEEVPRLGSSEANDILGASVVSKLDSPARHVLSYKKLNWYYEREWRVLGKIGHNTFCGSSSIERRPLINHIYLGSRIKKEHKEKIIEQSKYLGFTVRQMRVSDYSHKWEVAR